MDMYVKTKYRRALLYIEHTFFDGLKMLGQCLNMYVKEEKRL